MLHFRRNFKRSGGGGGGGGGVYDLLLHMQHEAQGGKGMYLVFMW